MSQPLTRYPDEINLVRSSQALEIIWQDGHVSLYPLAQLRAACACANCTDKHKQKDQAVVKPLIALPVLGTAPSAEIESLSHVGRYALGVLWRDKHDSIYPFDALAQLCPCAACAAQRQTEN